MNLSHLLGYHHCPHNAKVQMWEHLKTRIAAALDVGRTARDKIHDVETLEAHAATLRAFFLESIGGLPEMEAQSSAPRATLCGEVDQPGFILQKIVLETRPQVFATTNLYLPTYRNGRLPAVLFLCGHSVEGKAYPAYQVVCQIFARRGFAVLALDPAGQGERMNYYCEEAGQSVIRPGTEDHEYCGLPCLVQGHNLSRYLLQDAMRAIDYLSQHPAIDPSRIGVTGSSGGGTQTALMMLLEPRLAAAAPATFVTSRQAIFDTGGAQDSEQIWRGFTERGYDHLDLLAAFAPKPLCVASVTYDFFPIEGTRSTVKEARRFWEMHGAAAALHAVEDRHIHAYTEALGNAVCAFFARHLSPGEETAGPSSHPEHKKQALPIPSLWCTPQGAVRQHFPEVKTIHQENVEAFHRQQSADGEKSAPGLDFLRGAVFHSRTPVALNLRVTVDQPIGDLRCRSGYWWSQAGLINSAILLEDSRSQGIAKPVTMAIWEDGSSAACAHDAWIRREISQGRVVMILNLTGMGPLEPHPFNMVAPLKSYFATHFRIADDLITLGDSLAALRIYDVLRALETLPLWDGVSREEDTQIYCHGKYGIYGALASALEPRLALLPLRHEIPPYRQIIESEFYDNHDVKSLIIPGLIQHADWIDLLPRRGQEPASEAPPEIDFPHQSTQSTSRAKDSPPCFSFPVVSS